MAKVLFKNFSGLNVAHKVKAQSLSGLTVAFAHSHEEVLEAQRLRYKVFAEEMGANIPYAVDSEGRRIDADLFDKYCDHLIVRDNASGQVIGTYRILPPHGARRAGCSYSEGEFFLTRLAPMRANMVELGRSCVHQNYRSGAVIMLLWKGIAEYMKAGGYEYLFGCASIGMHDGGLAAATLFRTLERSYMASPEVHVFPRAPLPIESLVMDSAPFEAPPLVKGYLRVGAQICGAPAWDPDFNTADLPMLLSLSRMSPRYRKHFFGE
ncbi:MAG TPA: GNAT family N-acyltransferase [Burkholderiaceae bacterium]|nr:GNAT family N-acyltransferase [Burkholderiaceae bacterium]